MSINIGPPSVEELRPRITVIGVVGDVRHFGLEAEPRPELYRTYAVNPLSSPILVIRTRTEAAHWIAGAPPAARFDCTAQTRYRQNDEACTVTVLADGRLDVAFHRPQRAVTPGQSLVLYDGEECLGGAVIAGTDAPLESRIADLAA